MGPTHTTVHMGPWTYQSVASGTQEELEGDDSLPTISTSPELLSSLDHMACLYCPSVSISYIVDAKMISKTNTVRSWLKH